MKEVLRSRFSLTVLILALVSLSYAFSNNDYSNTAMTGDQLNDLILGNHENIIVTLWTMNIQNDEVQNKKNNIAKSSMRRLVSKCHTSVVYNEADVSDSNHQKSSYASLAADWNLDLNKLRDGPMVMVVFQTKGEMFWSTGDTMLIKLLDRIDANIRKIESKSLGGEAPKCSVKLDYNELDADFKNNLSSVSIGRSGSGSSSGSMSFGGSKSSGSGSGSGSKSGSYSGKGTYRSSSYDNSGDSYKSLSSENSEPAYLSSSYDNSETYARNPSSSYVAKGTIISSGSTSSSSESIEVRAAQPKPVYQKPAPKAEPKAAPTPAPKPKVTLKEPNKAMLRKV